jgi:uncharacterized protein (TIGR00645 family)
MVPQVPEQGHVAVTGKLPIGPVDGKAEAHAQPILPERRRFAPPSGLGEGSVRRAPPPVRPGAARVCNVAARREASLMLERPLERLLFACRWLLAPLYLGLSLALIVLGIKFFQEAIHVIMEVTALAEADLVLTVLAMVDLVLVGSLIVMVMFSGYENFVSRIDLEAGADAPAWLSKLDAGTLKLKVAASIVAISSIHLLRIFMNAHQVENDKIMWYVILHLTFVVSAVLLGVLDRISFAAHRKE